MQFLPYTGPTLYSEIGQNNPLRWELCHPVEDEVFQLDSGKFRCKDFFNDVAYYFQSGEKDIKIYSFKASGAVESEGGLFVRLTNLIKKEVFLENLWTINALPHIPGQLEYIDVEGEATIVLFIPKAFFSSTYYISLVTYLVRIANSDELFESDNLKAHPNVLVDCPVSPFYKDRLFEELFKPPFDVSEFTPIKSTDIYYIHNTGINGWYAAEVGA